MDSAFFRRLYQGYAAEHHVSSLLFARSYEVFRLPADFGLDLVVTDQFRVARGENANREAFPFSLQVKSRWLKSQEIVAGPNERPQATISFTLKREEVTLLQGQRNAAYAFVFYWPIQAPHYFQPHLFLLHSSSLETLVQCKFFRPRGQEYDFTVRFRQLPTYNRQSFVEEVKQSATISRELEQELSKKLPEQITRNWNASEYLQFARLPKNDQEDLVYRSVWNVPTDFSTFPLFERIGGLDG
jgi:hypothetical protein